MIINQTRMHIPMHIYTVFYAAYITFLVLFKNGEIALLFILTNRRTQNSHDKLTYKFRTIDDVTRINPIVLGAIWTNYCGL